MAYGPGHIPRIYLGAKALRVLCLVAQRLKTIVCVAFGDVTFRVPFCDFWHARANITLAHIWRPEGDKKAL